MGAAAPPGAGAAGRDFSMEAYSGLAAWIDVVDRGPWDRPERTVRGLARRGVGTLFVQTANYRQRGPLYRPAALNRMLATAEREGIRIVAWYLPGLAAFPLSAPARPL